MLNQFVEKYRRGTYFKYTFPTLGASAGGALLQDEPIRVEIHQKQYHHDVLVMEFTTAHNKWLTNVVTNLPVALTWIQDGVRKDWYGKVSFVSQATVGQRNETMEVHCISMSYPLKERATRIFKKKTIPDCVKEIASENGLKFVGDPHPRVFTQLSMGGHSYWEWIQEQAKRIGYAALVDEGTLYFRPLDKLIDQFSTDVPILQYSNGLAPINGQVPDKTLDYFKVLNGEYIESGHNHRTIKNTAGVDPITGKAFFSKNNPQTVGTNLRTKTGTPIFNEYRTEHIGLSQIDADSMSEASAQAARLNLPARVKAQGDPRLKPFGLVYIDGTNDLTDGYWVVQEVKHMIHRLGDYQVEMTVVTDGVGANVTSPFRSGSASITGTVNLQQALAQSSSGVSTPVGSTIVLSSTSALINQGAQGTFNPSTNWTAI